MKLMIIIVHLGCLMIKINMIVGVQGLRKHSSKELKRRRNKFYNNKLLKGFTWIILEGNKTCLIGQSTANDKR